MKRNILTTIGITAFFTLAILGVSALTETGTTSVYARTSGSPGGKTNSPTDGVSCTQCHSGIINSGSGTVELGSTIPAGGYVPGQTYTITNVMVQPAINKFGFEVTAERNSDNAKTGTFILTDAVKTAFANSNNAVTHTASGTSPLTPGVGTWSFEWTAPPAGTGDVTFYGAYNSVDGGGENVDQIYAKTLIVSEDITTTITENESQDLFNIYPNPVKNSFKIASEKEVQSVRIYNLQGKQVSSLTQGTTKVNIEHLPAGVYFVNVEIGGTIKTERLIKD